jgi:uncharacterized tellurite resistance protein B-like protein|tara:strand:- start:214 stop:621 length:408 start_codon:yes stop_codon:yes gene_type:complete
MSLKDIKEQKLQDRQAIVFAVIKMMLIDGYMDKRELSTIKKIYSFLFNKKLTHEKLKNLIFKVTQSNDFSKGESIVAETISRSIITKRSRREATEALILVMLADKNIHTSEHNLIQLICHAWDTYDIYDEYINDS